MSLKRKENALALSLRLSVGPKTIARSPISNLNENNMLDAKFAIAPMMDWTD